MEKSVVITAMVDHVDLKDLDELIEKLEAVFEDYEDKRINVSLQDQPMIAAR